MPDYYIIEHPTRGTLKFFVSKEEFGFSWSGMRNDPEKAMQFFSYREARRIKMNLPPKIAQKCVIRESSAWEVVTD